jgi:hypothetical protein
MDKRAGYDEEGRSVRAEVNSESSDRGGLASSTMDAMGSMVNSAVDLMVRIPFQATAAGLDWVTSGGQGSSSTAELRSQTTSGSGSQRSSQTSEISQTGYTGQKRQSASVNPSSESQELTGDDLKYVVWTIVFTKPEHETVIEPMQCELVNYSTDVSSFAALKMANALQRGRSGKLNKPAVWAEHSYPAESAMAKQRTESTTETSRVSAETSRSSTKATTESSTSEKGWRLPADDQKYLQFLYRVEWRLPKRSPEVTRVETVTVEEYSR